MCKAFSEPAIVTNSTVSTKISQLCSIRESQQKKSSAKESDQKVQQQQ